MFRSLQRVVALGQETINTPVYVQLDQNKAYVLTDCLQTIALVGEPCSGEYRRTSPW